MKFIHTVLSVLWELGGWDFCFDIDLCPLVWKLGVGVDLPEGGGMPENKVSVNLPTLRFELRWMRQSDMDAWMNKLDDLL